MMPCATALLTDLYELSMVHAYSSQGRTRAAVFEFFVRRLPPSRSFLMATGLEQALQFLENLRFSPEDLAWIEDCGRFRPGFADYLERLRFTGDVHAMPEGTVFFPDEPILRVTAPLPEAQLVETRLINLLQFQTMIASKAARCVLAAPGKRLVDFGLRRAHGAEAGLLAARASFIAGFSGTSAALAAPAFGIPVYGTMAHSFVQTFEDEAAAFEAFARANPGGASFLIDTYDTEAGAVKAAEVARRLAREGIRVRSVRIDSGNLALHARRVRDILDRAGHREISIFASGELDEHSLARLTAQGAPIDGYGVGTRMTTSADAPSLDCAYKIQEYDGRPRRKRSEGKTTWPGRKQVYRRADSSGRPIVDVLTTDGDAQEGTPLLALAMREGRRVSTPPSLRDVRERARGELERLPEPLRGLVKGEAYRVEISPALQELTRRLDREAFGLAAGGRP